MEKTIEQQLAEFKNKIYSDLEIQTQDNEGHLSPQRIGNFTGSGLKKLITCKSRKKGLDWSMREKLVDFGDTALNYCVEKACERITGQSIETPTTWKMQWGINHEPIAREEIHKQYGIEVPEQDFVFFLKNAGSTPDSFFSEFKSRKNVNVEIKCPPKFLNHAKYLSQPVDESHEYFWQIQAEMMSQSKARGIFCNKTAFFSFHPNFSESTKLGGTIVDASNLHRLAIITRCIIGERIIQGLMQDDLRKMPHTYLPGAIEDIPSDWTDIQVWLNKAIEEVRL